MLNNESLLEALKDAIEGTKVFIVEVKLSATNKISITLDHPDGLPVDECARVSKHIESVFDRDEEDYELQVSSPGIEQAFKVTGQYTKNIGREVRVILRDGTTFEGFLTHVSDNEITVEWTELSKLPGQKKKEEKKFTEVIALNDIASTKLNLRF
ncbi:MAG: ribosome assembly cofactor RimP [Salinivirgaceae bacterium]|jgi:ribosome maturation factor RimP|nr:ribosome assembly cofactor RimP [Salinivirgaceae bacterium]